MNRPGIGFPGAAPTGACVVLQALKPKSNKRGGSATAQSSAVELSGGASNRVAAQWRVKLTEADGTTPGGAVKPNKVSGPSGQAKGIPTAKVAGINSSAQLSRDQAARDYANSAWESDAANKRIYVFVRAEGFYPIELENDAAAKANAAINPGTLKVIRMLPLPEVTLWESV